MKENVDILIIGAGIIGSSVAMHLAKKGVTNIRVIDFDLEGSLSSSELNAGGVRATWLQPLNIQLSKATIEYLAQHAEEVGYRACGYLWLQTSEKLKGAEKARALQERLGWQVDLLDLTALRSKVPFLDKTDGIAGATFSPRDGLVNSNLLKNHFRKEAKAFGVVFDDRTVLKEAVFSRNGKTFFKLLADRYEGKSQFGTLDSDQKLEVATRFTCSAPVQKVEYEAQIVINCAGAWANQIARILNYSSPSKAVRRQVCLFNTQEVDLSPYGMIVDTSGVYFHPEASFGLAGYADHEELSGINFEYDGENFFEERIWPALYERSSGFEKLKHLNGWAGQYEVSPDDSAILGNVMLSGTKFDDRLFEAHSFSGHGVMQSYSAGLALAERIVEGKFVTFDASRLNGHRFETGELLPENMVI